MEKQTMDTNDELLNRVVEIYELAEDASDDDIANLARAVKSNLGNHRDFAQADAAFGICWAQAMALCSGLIAAQERRDERVTQ